LYSLGAIADSIGIRKPLKNFFGGGVRVFSEGGLSLYGLGDEYLCTQGKKLAVAGFEKPFSALFHTEIGYSNRAGRSLPETLTNQAFKSFKRRFLSVDRRTFASSQNEWLN
jgi:hypothetical protein